MYKILLATDGSEYSLQSLQKVIPLAKAVQAKLTILSIAEEMPFLRGTEGLSKEELETLYSSIAREAEIGLNNAKELFEAEGLDVKTSLKAGRAAETICKVAEDGDYDLIVIGDTGRGGLKELFLGSVSNKVAHQARTDVMIVKRNN